jgi:hypothetical protein
MRPLEQMCEQYNHAAGQLTLFAFAHVFNLPCNMFDIQQVKAACTQ